MVESEVDVLVVGGALGGLSTAMFLAQRGVRVLLAERHGTTSLHRKAAGLNPRTMELLRIGGVLGRIREAADDRGDRGSRGDFGIKVAETVGGPVLRSVAEGLDDIVRETEQCSPQRWTPAGQDRIEPVLRKQAEAYGATIRFGTELVSFEHSDDAGVTARLRDLEDGAEHTVRARYLVAADGPRSTIRESLGVTRHGHGSLAHFMTIVFDADLSTVLPPGAAGWYYLRNPAFSGTFGPAGRPGRYSLYVRYAPEQGESAEDFTPQRCLELIRLAVNAPDLRAELVETQPWEMAARIADRWRVGRVLLVGDAAKVMPPTGGMGGNTAIGDGFDVAWKLAAVLRGEAGEALLDSYAEERSGIARLVSGEALSLYADRMAPQLADSVPEKLGNARVLLGFRYRSGAVAEPDDIAAASDTGSGAGVGSGDELTEDPLRPSGRAGFRAPHGWVERDGGERRSVLDLFGDGWVLLAAPGGARWSAAATRAARELGVPLDAHTLGDGLVDTDAVLASRYGIGAAGASLVRPDGVVAWRTADAPSDGAAGTLRSVLTRVLAR
ncbi:FAD-dependent monooxygenase [Streptomyces sp. LP05-1]|uniref:FAD-dependent monooxygenase n=1 Tax=Streptomyces pyxinae TaxID=2970734 RepID=A0ABT2CEI8_9ACTN|nr:FAD-dependent monooxygenase [Streptomyces sp. LP05-1]MCS0635781.1 FAD-dependent monooxygenase [Streptomyces sp. LP05-1]